MKIAINGALGRMGRMLVEVAEAAGDVEVSCLVERTDHPETGRPVSTPWGDLPLCNTAAGLPGGVQAGIDFSLPDGAVEFISSCTSQGVPVVSGTTGLSEEQFERIRDCAEKAPVLWAPNTSLGVFCLHEVSESARRILGPSYDVEIVEIHHRHKRDAPSGTALSLANRLAEEETNVVHGRDGEIGARRREELGVHAVRGGEVVGEHTVLFLGDSDRLEITHRAGSRRIFAEGGLALARRLLTREPGLYTVKDLLGTN